MDAATVAVCSPVEAHEEDVYSDRDQGLVRRSARPHHRLALLLGVASLLWRRRVVQ